MTVTPHTPTTCHLLFMLLLLLIRPVARLSDPVANPCSTTLQQEYYENDDKVPPAKRNSFLSWWHHAPSVIPGFDLNTTAPYPIFKEVKGFKTLFKQQSKEMIGQEARRRDPLFRMNSHNKFNEEMVKDLNSKLGYLLTPADKEFLLKKESSEMRAILFTQAASMGDSVNVRSVLSSSDQLCLAAGIGLERNLLLLKRSQQDCSTRMELDIGVSPKQKLYDGLLADTFNDES
jgi:hypothetical protein